MIGPVRAESDCADVCAPAATAVMSCKPVRMSLPCGIPFENQPITVRVTHREAYDTNFKLTPQHEILVANGDEVTEGQLLARLGEGDEAAVPGPLEALALLDPDDDVTVLTATFMRLKREGFVHEGIYLRVGGATHPVLVSVRQHHDVTAFGPVPLEPLRQLAHRAGADHRGRVFDRVSRLRAPHAPAPAW